MVGRHPIAVLANLAVLNRGVLGRGRGRTIGVIVDRHVVDALVDAAHLELIEAFLEELHVAATVADLGVEPRADGIVVRLGPHIVGGGHEDALLFDLALDVEDGLIFVHGGRGRAMRSRKTVEMLQGPEGREGEEGGGLCAKLPGALTAGNVSAGEDKTSREACVYRRGGSGR